MASRTRIRRRAAKRTRAAKVRRCACQGAQTARADAKGKMEGSGGVLIGGAHDPAEKAADRMAAQALSGGPVSASSAGSGAVHRECAKCAEEKEAKRDASPGATVASGAGSARASAPASNAINGLGSGRPLARSERSFFEPRFGRDFSNVRVHEDGAADKAARAIDARAFAYGDDIAFAKGERAKGGDRLMAHELAHVAQEGGAARRTVRRLPKCEVGRKCPKREKGEKTWSKRKGLQAMVISSPKNGFLVWNFQVGSTSAKGLAKNKNWTSFMAQVRAEKSIWQIKGFADCVGSESKNIELRVNRPFSVWDQAPTDVRSKLVPIPQVGECVTDNSTKENRAFNRSALVEKVIEVHDFPEMEIEGKRKKSPYVGCFDGSKLTVSKGGDTASCEAFSSKGDPTPEGKYCIRLQGATQTKGHSSWFLIEPQFKTKRSRMHIHPGSNSLGCVTVKKKDKCFDKIAKILNKSGTETGWGHDGCPPSNTDCKRTTWDLRRLPRYEPKENKDCTGFLKVKYGAKGCADFP